MKNKLLISIVLGFVLLFAGCTSQKADLSGAAGIPACVDTDGGNVVGVKGTTTAAGVSKTDACDLTGTTLTEYYCLNNKLTSIAGKCAAGKVCRLGACVATSTQVQSCRVVNGIVQHTAANGVVTNYANGCNAQGSLVSYSCLANGSVNTQAVACGAGMMCQAGVCVNAPVVTCADTDRGSTEVRGTVTITTDGRAGTPSVDSCVDQTTVKEYSCNGNIASSANVACLGGRVCTDGACVMPVAPVQTCTDSDGQNIQTQGEVVVTLVNEVLARSRDACNGATTVTEISCSAQNTVVLTDIACAAGQICQNGACVAAPQAPVPCVDSDGADVTRMGTVTVGNVVSTDACVPNNPRVVNEFTCIDNLARPTTMPCAAGFACSNGACVEETFTCTPNEYGVRFVSSVTGQPNYALARYNSCNPERTIATRYSCDANNQATPTSVECAQGEVCSDASCVQSTCGEEIAGGFRAMNGTEYTNACRGSWGVDTYQCVEVGNGAHEIQGRYVPCAQGTTCSNGVCQ